MLIAFLFSILLLPQVSFADDPYGNYYRDARLFGKVINDHIVYGTLYFRANDGSFVNYANKTYWMVQPMYSDDINQIQANISNTVILNGKMLGGMSAGQEVFAYYNLEPSDYSIKLDQGVYFGRLQSSTDMIGFPVDPNNGMADLLTKLKILADMNLTNSKSQAQTSNFISNYLVHVSLLPESDDVQDNLYNRTDLLVLAQGNTGNNFLVTSADISEGHIRKFISENGNYNVPSNTDINQPMTIYGQIKEVKSKYAPTKVYITGASASTLAQWVDMLKDSVNNPNNIGGECIKVGLDPDSVKDGDLLIVSGTKVFLKTDTECSLSPGIVMTPQDVIKALDNLRQITN